MTDLGAKRLCIDAGGRRIVDDASFALGPGELVVLLGPNGAGKSSLLRAALGLLSPASGVATVAGAPIAGMAAAQRARAIAYLPQSRPLAWPQRVRDVVALGRFAHGVAPGRLRARDAQAVAKAIEDADLAPLAHRITDTLSGGELARVHLARALAAETPLMIVDEPVAALDPRHQHRVMAILRDFAMRGGGVLAVLHDLDLAARYADRLIWMVDGRIVADGDVRATMTPKRIAETYGVDARVTPVDDHLQVVVTGAL